MMANFNQERLTLSAQVWAFARLCCDEALAHARERNTFGRPLIKRQVIRQKLVDTCA
ncbi:MAG: acyl-CoA dehydrogenase family protein [Solimonas sp.]